MLDHLAAREALRARALTLVVATTGTMELGATTAGYTRTAGSFLSDGFAAGMEVVPAGFPTNAAKMIESVTDTLVTITGGLSSSVAAASGRALTVGLPVARQWENTQTPYTTTPGVRPYIAEQWVPATGDSAADEFAMVADTGMYVLTWYGLANKGVLAMYRQMKALRNLFPPGLNLAVGDDSDWLRILGTPGPSIGQLIPLENGYVTSTLRIPWRAVSATVAA